jgi:hypothetical protein
MTTAVKSKPLALSLPKGVHRMWRYAEKRASTGSALTVIFAVYFSTNACAHSCGGAFQARCAAQRPFRRQPLR